MQTSTSGDGRPPQLERANGALVEIDHDSEVRFHLRGGKVYHFRHPVSARVEGESLIVRGANAPDTNIPLQDIDKTEVRKFDGRATAGGIVVGVLAGLAVTYIVAKDQTK